MKHNDTTPNKTRGHDESTDEKLASAWPAAAGYARLDETGDVHTWHSTRDHRTARRYRQ